MSGLWGADVDQLRKLGREFAAASAALTAVRSTLDAQVEQIAWTGPDATEFTDQWHGYLRGMLDAAITALEEGSATAASNADAQDAASAAEDGGGEAAVPVAAGQPGTTAGPVAHGAAVGSDATGAQNPPEVDAFSGAHPDITAYEEALHRAGMLGAEAPDGPYREWLENAADRGIDVETIVEIATTYNIKPATFDVLDGWTRFADPDGKTFFLLPKDVDSADAAAAVVLSYIYNAGTDYGTASLNNDFSETPYSADEVGRIIDRQAENLWSYRDDIAYVHDRQGRLVTTPNGILMGVNGSAILSQGGGTTWGDIFMLNIDGVDKPAGALKQVIESGRMNYQAEDGSFGAGALDLDRVLHHEEVHSQQWAREGYADFLAKYGAESVWVGINNFFGGSNTNDFEEEAGLRDGGYA